MAKLLLIVLLIYGGVVFFDKRASPEVSVAADALVIEDNASYVAVYGRESCGFTRQMLSTLKQAGMEYRFYSVDDRKVSDSLHARMQQKGLDTSHYLLPVVEVSGHMSIRPEFAQVSSRYRMVDGH